MHELKIFNNTDFGEVRTLEENGKLLPTAGKSDSLFEVKECYNDKTQWSGTQTLVTPKGRETFRLLCQGV